jgi:predicted HTH domain antitoxin
MTLTLEVPEAFIKALGATPADAAAEMRLVAAMKLHEIGRVSSGAAAQFAGLSRVEFLSKLGKYGVPAFQMAPEELEEDVTNALQDVRRDG